MTWLFQLEQKLGKQYVATRFSKSEVLRTLRSPSLSSYGSCIGNSAKAGRPKLQVHEGNLENAQSK